MQENTLTRNQPKGRRLSVITQVTAKAIHAATNHKDGREKTALNQLSQTGNKKAAKRRDDIAGTALT